MCCLFESICFDALRLLSTLGDSVLGNIEESPMTPREFGWPITWHSNTFWSTVLLPLSWLGYGTWFLHPRHKCISGISFIIVGLRIPRILNHSIIPIPFMFLLFMFCALVSFLYKCCLFTFQLLNNVALHSFVNSLHSCIFPFLVSSYLC